MPGFVYIAARATYEPHKKQFGRPWSDLYCFFSDNMIRAIWDKEDYAKNALFVTKQFIEREYFDNKMKKYEGLTRNLSDQMAAIEKMNLDELSGNEFIKTVKEFNEYFLNWWGFAQVAEMIATGSEIMLKKIKDIAGDQYDILTTPTEKSYSLEEEEEILGLTKEVLNNFELRQVFSSEVKQIIQVLKKDYSDLYKRLQRHQQKYHWLLNGYLETKYLGVDYFVAKIKEVLQKDFDVAKIDKIVASSQERLEEYRVSKEKVINELSLSEKDRAVVELVDHFAIFQDDRKAFSLEANYCTGQFMREIARRSSWDEEVVNFILPEEYEDVLSGKIMLEQAQKRVKHCSNIFTSQGEQLLVGKESIAKEKEIMDGEVEKKVNEFEGMRAMGGKITGVVRKILLPKDMDTMQEGEILVSTMTSPDFVPAMKKAKAIITDEGGITCHAAVIARELGIPCVIGTKIATRVLESGDQVEVNANHGIIKVIR